MNGIITHLFYANVSLMRNYGCFICMLDLLQVTQPFWFIKIGETNDERKRNTKEQKSE